MISHVILDASEHPIAYAFMSLLSAEKNYSQLEREQETLESRNFISSFEDGFSL